MDGLHRLSIGAARSWPTALENGRVRAAETLWRLHFETGYWRDNFLINRTSGSGRDCEFAVQLDSGPSLQLGVSG